MNILGAFGFGTTSNSGGGPTAFTRLFRFAKTDPTTFRTAVVVEYLYIGLYKPQALSYVLHIRHGRDDMQNEPEVQGPPWIMWVINRRNGIQYGEKPRRMYPKKIRASKKLARA